jgi:site-specific DNA recombinase
MNVIRALLYARVSSKVQKRRSQADLDEPSLAQQQEAMAQTARQRGWTIVAALEDVITGGVPVKERPAGALIYAKANNDEFDVLVVYDNDRIGRDEDAVVAKVFRADLRRQGKQIFSVHQPVEPRPPADYQPYEDDSALWLEAVSDTASSVSIRQFRRRHAFGMHNRIAQKKLMPGAVPIGYQAERHRLPNGKSVLGQRSVDPLYAPMIRRIFDLYEAGHSFLKVATLLNIEGLRTPQGNLWSPSATRGIINNPTYYGAAVYYKGRSTGKPDPRYPGRRRRCRQPMERWLVVEDAQHPAIIAKEQWERCQALKRSRDWAGRTYGESTLLSGLVQCGKCAAPLYRNGGWGGGFFSCSRYKTTGRTECCPNSINRQKLEAQVIEYLVQVAHRPEILARLQINQAAEDRSRGQEEIGALQAQQAEVMKRLQKARDAYEAGVDSIQEYARRKGSLQEQQEEIAARLEALQHRVSLTAQQREVQQSLLTLLEEFPDRFNSRPLSLQKLLLREIIQKVVVNDRQVTILFRDDPFSSFEYARAIEIIRAYSDGDTNLTTA